MIERPILFVIRFGTSVLRWLACMTFFRPLGWRSYIPLRATGMLLLGSGLDWIIWELMPFEFYHIIIPVWMLCYSVLVGAVCTQAKWSMLLYCAIWAMLTYSAISELWWILYDESLPFSIDTVPPILLWAGLTAGIYLILWFTVSRWMPVYASGYVGPRQTVSAVLLYVIFAALTFGFYQHGVFTPHGLTGVLVIMAQGYCAIVLYLQTALFKKSAIQRELDTMNLLWHQQQLQYERSKENIAIINQKCHDLKHQLAAMRTMESSTQREKYIREIQKSVNIYDAMVQTGNETLDTVLTEKSLICEAKHITVNCVADGASLNFMDPVDIYTIMGNAMDNAMEAVSAFEEEALRVIDVLIHTRQRFLIISVTNPLKGALTFEDGVPCSTKPQDGYHGFGVRSIRSTIHKYHGELTVEAKDGSFSLRMLLPLPEEP